MRKKKNDTNILREIEIYAKCNLIVIMAILCLEIVAAFWAVGSAIYKVYYDSDSKIYRWSIGFLIGFGVLEIIVANLSTKKRNKYIETCKSL